MDIPQEELEGSQSLDPDWPFQGQIEFRNVTMRYMPSLPPALNDVSFTIVGGTQVSAHEPNNEQHLFLEPKHSSGQIFML